MSDRFIFWALTLTGLAIVWLLVELAHVALLEWRWRRTNRRGRRLTGWMRIHGGIE